MGVCRGVFVGMCVKGVWSVVYDILLVDLVVDIILTNSHFFSFLFMRCITNLFNQSVVV